MSEINPSLEAELAGLRKLAVEKVGPETISVMAGATAKLAASGIADRVLKAGDRAPEFALPNVRGERIGLGDLLGRGAVVLAFYRGGW